MEYMKDKTLNHIYKKFFIERKEFRTIEKISFLEKASLFIPGINFLTSFHINKKIKKEIERAERESNIKIEGYNEGCYDPLYNKINIWLLIIFLLTLPKVIIYPSLSFFTFACGITSLFSGFLFGIVAKLGGEFSTKSLENFINNNNFKKDEALSENDMLLLTKNINHDILNDFLIERDFEITYRSLLELQEKIDEYDDLKEEREKELENKIKANSILSVLSEKIKEKEVINV